MTPHSLISTTTQCKCSLLHLSHGTSVSKSLLDLHLRLVPRNPFLAIFTLSSHTQVTSYKHPLKKIFNIVILTWISSGYECWDQSSFSLIHLDWHIWITINMVKPIHDSLYPLHFGLTLLTLQCLFSYFYLDQINGKWLFKSLCI
jgi:hypothetical protein